MKTQHTPGPWTISDLDPFDGEEDTTIIHKEFPLAIVRGTNDMACIDAEDVPRINQEMMANARLIAAAPELLDACNEAVSTIEMLMGDNLNPSASMSLASIIKAINKAKGE